MSDEYLLVEGKPVKVDGDVWDSILSEISWQMFRTNYGKRVVSEIDDERVVYREGIES